MISFKGWSLRRNAKAASDEINGKIKANLERLQTPPIAGPIFLGLKAKVESAVRSPYIMINYVITGR
jgi:hypothetical protein